MHNQDQVSVASRNCNTNVPGPINLYSINNQIVFGLQQANVGFDMNGQLCNLFEAQPSAGNANCPIGIGFTVTPQCDPNLPNCFNPLYLIQGKFTRNGGDSSRVLNLSPYNFSILESGFYCPPQDPSVALTGDSEIDVNTTQVIGKFDPIQDGHFATTDPLILPCRSVTFNFVINAANYSLTKANNKTIICLTDESVGSCGITFVSKVLPDGTYSFDLMEGTNLVATKPSWMNLTGAENFEIKISNGLVKFSVDAHCLHIFEQKLEGPSRLRLNPGWVTTPGLAIVDLFSVVFLEI